MTFDHQEITAALKAWFRPGEVFEVRALEATTKQWNTRPHTEAGYFDLEHLPDLLRSLDTLTAYKGIYVTLNPLTPAVLGRARYVFKHDKLIGAKDEEVLCRRWLPIDCDAKRVSGVPSSEDEHAHALAKARDIRDGFASMGWPDPIFIDSGNGAQLLYRLPDLPPGSDLVKRTLEALQPCSDDHVEIDQTVFNPARIWRLPGTLNRKGDPCPEQLRHHRPSRVLVLPAADVVVPLHTLEASMPRSVEAPKTIETLSFSLTAFIARHFPNAKPTPYNGGTKWVLDVCPFNPDHNDRSAVITQTSEGRIGFVCHHNGCSGKTWHDLRTLLEPPTSLPDVSIDTTAILQRKAPTPPPPPRVVPQKEWEKVTLETLEREVLPGTILERITRLLSQVTTPPLPLAFTLPKALVLIGAALSERTDEEGPASRQGVELARLALNSAGGQVCNMYCLLAAPSGTGKDIGGLEEKMARRNNWFVGSAGSKEGLYDAYMVKPNGILKISELQPYLEPRHWQHEAAQFFTEAFNQGAFNHCQSMRVKNAVPRQSNYCYPNVLANIQPDVFERIARPIDIESGLLGRFLVSHAPHFCGDPGRFNLKETLSTLQSYLDLFTRKCGLLDLPDHYASDLKASLMEDAPSMMFSHIARLCNEYYPRLATVLSVTESATTQGSEVLLTPDVWHRAKLLIHWFYHNAYRLFGRITDDDDRSRRRETVLLRVLRRARKVDCPHGFTRRDISLGGLKGTDAKERKEALDEMLDRGWLTLEGLSYHLTDLAPELDC